MELTWYLRFINTNFDTIFFYHKLHFLRDSEICRYFCSVLAGQTQNNNKIVDVLTVFKFLSHPNIHVGRYSLNFHQRKNITAKTFHILIGGIKKYS